MKDGNDVQLAVANSHMVPCHDINHVWRPLALALARSLEWSCSEVAYLQGLVMQVEGKAAYSSSAYVTLASAPYRKFSLGLSTSHRCFSLSNSLFLDRSGDGHRLYGTWKLIHPMRRLAPLPTQAQAPGQNHNHRAPGRTVHWLLLLLSSF